MTDRTTVLASWWKEDKYVTKKEFESDEIFLRIKINNQITTLYL
jgi:hypothetical protein